jgi:hypothetical protein
MPRGETRLVARWEWIGVGLTTGRLRAASTHVTLTANIWPDDLYEPLGERRWRHNGRMGSAPPPPFTAAVMTLDSALLVC